MRSGWSVDPGFGDRSAGKAGMAEKSLPSASLSSSHSHPPPRSTCPPFASTSDLHPLSGPTTSVFAQVASLSE